MPAADLMGPGIIALLGAVKSEYPFLLIRQCRHHLRGKAAGVIPLRPHPGPRVIEMQASPPALRGISAAGVNQPAVERDHASRGRFEIHRILLILFMIDRRAW